MIVADLYVPVVGATVINAFLFAGAWRGHQIERSTGKDPWWFGVGLVAYSLIVGIFAYLRSEQRVSNSFDLFGAALFAEATGVLIVFGILKAVAYARARPGKDHPSR